ncbi:hypothetical protein PR048_031644 [Dryococelus australis]|uniref:Uncharacterized protein n=1 Tax=Dryococelus australis TaxID=614101 RepID=A0ABQ9G9W4_9NEOP|nr:hypothetical protein PR048_031644 [Dryococelus australis]
MRKESASACITIPAYVWSDFGKPWETESGWPHKNLNAGRPLGTCRDSAVITAATCKVARCTTWQRRKLVHPLPRAGRVSASSGGVTRQADVAGGHKAQLVGWGRNRDNSLPIWLDNSPPTYMGELGSISCGVTLGCSHVGIVPDDAAGRRVFSRSPPPPPLSPSLIAVLLHTPLASALSALKTSMLRTVHIFSLARSNDLCRRDKISVDWAFRYLYLPPKRVEESSTRSSLFRDPKERRCAAVKPVTVQRCMATSGVGNLAAIVQSKSAVVYRDNDPKHRHENLAVVAVQSSTNVSYATTNVFGEILTDSDLVLDLHRPDGSGQEGRAPWSAVRPSLGMEMSGLHGHARARVLVLSFLSGSELTVTWRGARARLLHLGVPCPPPDRELSSCPLPFLFLVPATSPLPVTTREVFLVRRRLRNSPELSASYLTGKPTWITLVEGKRPTTMPTAIPPLHLGKGREELDFLSDNAFLRGVFVKFLQRGREASCEMKAGPMTFSYNAEQTGQIIPTTNQGASRHFGMIRVVCTDKVGRSHLYGAWTMSILPTIQCVVTRRYYKHNAIQKSVRQVDWLLERERDINSKYKSALVRGTDHTDQCHRHFTSLGRYSLSAGVDRSLVRDLGHPVGYQLVCGGEEKLTPSPLLTHQNYFKLQCNIIVQDSQGVEMSHERGEVACSKEFHEFMEILHYVSHLSRRISLARAGLRLCVWHRRGVKILISGECRGAVKREMRICRVPARRAES